MGWKEGWGGGGNFVLVTCMDDNTTLTVTGSGEVPCLTTCSLIFLCNVYSFWEYLT